MDLVLAVALGRPLLNHHTISGADLLGVDAPMLGRDGGRLKGLGEWMGEGFVLTRGALLVGGLLLHQSMVAIQNGAARCYPPKQPCAMNIRQIAWTIAARFCNKACTSLRRHKDIASTRSASASGTPPPGKMTRAKRIF